MKRPLQLSLAIALALGVTNAFALGLGAIQVQSGLNQPLKAEIPIIQSAPGEAEGLIVQLASVEDFERVGMNRSSIGVPVEFSLAKNARGEPVIRVTSKEIVREPFVGLLLEANWPKGRLLREYTVLLDPPVMAPAVKGSSAVAVAAAEPERTATQPLPPSKPAAASRPAATAPAAPARPATARTEPAATPKAAPRAVSGNEYGPVAAGETLGEIARATRPDESVSVNQMMLALLKSNPNAFFKDNINALKRGAVLRIPNAEEVAANGSAREAAAAVRSQIDEWRGSVSSAPTLVADTTAASAPKPAGSGTASVSTSSGERLALVPPMEGKAGQQSADRPGGGRAGGTGDAASKAELARIKEALTSKEQESGELKSRVKDLEDIRGKNEKLISLQSTELAELREKLRKLQDEESRAAAAAATAAAKAAENAATVKAEPAMPASAAPTTPTTPTTVPAKPGTAVVDAKITKDDIWGDADAAGKLGTAPATVEPAAGTPGAPAPDNAAGTPASPTSAPSATASAPTTQVPPVSEKPVPAVARKVPPKAEVKKPVTTAKAASPASGPWYLEPWALGAAGVGGLLLVVLGIFGLRKRKPVSSTARTSIASTFGDSPIGVVPAGSIADDAEEQELIAQIQADPTNPGAHLELLSLYYAQGDSQKFEAAAEEMYAYVADPNQPAWREVRTMGEELVPHNPLFSSKDSIVGSFSSDEGGEEYRFDEPMAEEALDFPDFPDETAQASTSESSLRTASMSAIDVSGFDLGDTQPPQSGASADTSFSFDLPPIEEVPGMKDHSLDLPEDRPVAATAAAEAADDEFFAGEDAIGTKLDLAKAYLDMGDPEGARSMLEEVLAEGAPSQQEEARKLISEIG